MFEKLNTESSKENHKRESFNNDSSYWLLSAGLYIGYNAIWFVPYMMYRNGGIIFFIPYFLLVIFFSAPTYLFESAIGQYFREPISKIYQRVSKKWFGQPLMFIVGNIGFSITYSLIMVWSTIYFLYSFSYTLPWNYKLVDDVTYQNRAQEFFYSEILNLSADKNKQGCLIPRTVVGFIACWLIIFFCQKNGIKSTGKIAAYTVNIPFQLLFFMLIWSLTLEGSWNGLKYYMYPRWEYLYNIKTWADAANMAFFNFANGKGNLQFQTSFRKVDKKLKLQSVMIPIIVVITHLFTSVQVFSILGYYTNVKQISFENLDINGPDLLFITYPVIMSTLPWQNFQNILFYLSLILLGIDTLFGVVEFITYFIKEDLELKYSREKIVGIYCVCSVILGLPICTQGGIFLIMTCFEYLFCFLAPIGNILNITIFLSFTNYDSQLRQLSIVTKEKYESFWFIQIKYVIYYAMYFCIILAIWNKFDKIYNNHANWQDFISFFIVAIELFVLVYFYQKYRKDTNNYEIYNLDLKKNDLLGANFNSNSSKELQNLNN